MRKRRGDRIRRGWRRWLAGVIEAVTGMITDW